MRACLFIMLFSAALFAQTPARFAAADVRVSPHSENNFNLFMRGPQTRAGRYEIRTATMVDLIAAAYGVDDDKIFGGPNWLELDRYDITAKLPEGSTKESQRAMLQDLLVERFHLVAKPDTRPMPAYILTASKSPKLTEGDPDGPKACNGKPRPQGAEPTYPNIVDCTNQTAAEIANDLHDMAGGYLRQPVIDFTGLKGAYSFELKWTSRGQLAAAGADGISIFDAVDKLGLKLELKTAPLPAVVVESVDQKPTPNEAGIESVLPGVTEPTEFEVAEVKLMPPDSETNRFQILPSGRVDIEGFDLKFIVEQLWQVSDEMLVNAPKWMSDVKVSITAKAPTPALVTGNNAPPVDIDTLITMIKNLMAERFKLQTHMEERPINAYTLTAVKPRMKPADPNGRIHCVEGPAAGQADTRDAHPILGRLLSCQNMTMSRFAGMLQNLANGYIHAPVLDATNLPGAWDFTLSFSTAGQLTSGGQVKSESELNAASDPNGAVSLPDAVSKQLGLKLELTKRPVQVLVIDHVEPKPTEN